MGIYYLLSVFSGISIAMCLFMIIYLFVGIKEKNLKKTFLILLIIAISLRILKSILYYVAVSEFSIMSSVGIIIGFLGFSSFGPLTYWFFKYNSTQKSRDFYKSEYLHLIFPVLGSLFMSITEKYDSTMYLACNISLTIYLTYIYFKYIFRRRKIDGTVLKLDKAIFLVMSLILLIFLIQQFTATIQWYVIGTGISSLVICGLFIYMLKYPPSLMKAINKTKPKPEQIKKIIEALEVKNLYHKQGVSLTEFSKIIDIPKYIISITIKDKYKKSFPELINHLRIEDVIKKLKSPDSVNIKIEELAFDVGFNSTSSFYTAFKKETSMTPREFQKGAILNL